MQPTASGSPALALERITCTFVSGDERPSRYTALRDATLTVGAGEFVSVVGPTGCGKSTLLNVAAGLLQPSSGSVRVFGEPLAGINARAGYLFQADALMPWRSALDNVVAGLQFRRVGGAEAAELGDQWLRRVGLGGFGDRYPHQLSGGMKKRAGLARAIALDPKVLFYDEPSAGLDPVTSAEIDKLIIDLNRKLGVTSVVVTHEMDSAFRIADRMVLLDRGKFIVSGTPKEMRENKDPLVHQFINGLAEGPLTDRRRAGGYETDLLAEKI